jgi:hypothetical protein
LVTVAVVSFVVFTVPVRFDRETTTSSSELSVFGQFIGNIGCFYPESDADALTAARGCGHVAS